MDSDSIFIVWVSWFGDELEFIIELHLVQPGIVTVVGVSGNTGGLQSVSILGQRLRRRALFAGYGDFDDHGGRSDGGFELGNDEVNGG
mgnify:CR=1 FL=1